MPEICLYNSSTFIHCACVAVFRLVVSGLTFKCDIFTGEKGVNEKEH